MNNPFKNVFDTAEEWFVNVPSGLRERICQFAQHVVLEAAKVCEARREDHNVVYKKYERGTHNIASEEAGHCAHNIRYYLLCKPGEYVCHFCHGDGCTQCDNKGIKKVKP